MRRHDLHLVSLVAGVVFVGLGLSALVADSAAVSLDWRWLWPPILIGAGVAGLVASRPKSDDDSG